MNARTKRNLEYTLSTFAVEKLRPSKSAIRLYERMDAGKLTLKDTIAAIERQHGIAGKNRA